MAQLRHTRTVALAGGGAMPMVGLGTWQLRGQRGYEAIRYALEVGYRHIDTATMYGNEADVGRALRDSGVDRREVFVTTKLPPGNAGRERETLDASLRALGTGYVDLWLVHWPPRSTAALGTWQAFLAAREQGLARAVGVSNYRVDQIDGLIAGTGQAPAVNQVPFSPTRFDARLLAGHSGRRVVVEGYSPLKDTDLGSPVLAGIASRHRVTPAQVVLRWHVERGIPVIPKSADPQRIAANLDVFGFSLDADEVAAVDRMRG
ncbi:MAG TPA: aldo/keto reductase [Micromonosporaceae bacterium]|nr:aldo/keto reductase [Micromonosporaceae bacterium]